MIFQILILVVCYTCWIQSQRLLSTDNVIDNKITDRIHSSSLFLSVHKYLKSNPEIARLHTIATSFLIDLNILIMFMNLFYYENYEPIIIFFIGIFLRQICQYINRLPIPDDVIWKDPGVYSIFITYDTTNDLFFSGHTFTAMTTGMMFYSSSNFLLQIYGIFFILYEIFFVLITRSHYFMDVYTGVCTYFMIKYLLF